MLNWCDSCEQKVSSTNIAEPSDSHKDFEEWQWLYSVTVFFVII